MSNTIWFENSRQVVLYQCELKGQISDGNWENSRPLDHYKIMCDAEVKVADDGVGKLNFTPKRKYNFADKDLVRSVGHRMMWYVKLHLVHPDIPVRDIGGLPEGLECLRSAYKSSRPGNYWESEIDLALTTLRVCTKNDLIEKYQEITDYDEYTEKDLVKDLRAMRNILSRSE